MTEFVKTDIMYNTFNTFLKWKTNEYSFDFYSKNIY